LFIQELLTIFSYLSVTYLGVQYSHSIYNNKRKMGSFLADFQFRAERKKVTSRAELLTIFSYLTDTYLGVQYSHSNKDYQFCGEIAATLQKMRVSSVMEI